MIYEENMKALEATNPRIYKAIIAGDIEYDHMEVSVEESRNGEKILVCHNSEKNIYLNSRYNPTNEAQKLMEEFADMPDESLLFVFGFSNSSYVREYLACGNPNTKVIVHEPSAKVFMAVINDIDIKDILYSDRVYISVTGINEAMFDSALEKFIKIFNRDTNKMMVSPQYTTLFHDANLQFNSHIVSQYEKLNIVHNTEITQGKRAVKNSIYNMKYLEGCRSGKSLIGAFPEDMIAVVVAAGPSLEKNINLLKDAKGRAFIIVVDSAISAVLKTGIVPDMIVSIDMNKSPALFTDPGVDEIPFITDMNMNTQVFDSLKPRNLYFGTSDSGVWARMFSEAGGRIDGRTTGGSVATAAISYLVEWGFKRIVLLGQDLTFTDSKIHVGEGESSLELDDRFSFVEDIYGKMQPIRKDYELYLRWIEDAAYTFPDIDFIDATEGGARIKHTRVMTFRQVIDAYCQKDFDVNGILEKVPRFFYGENKKVIIDSLNGMKNNLRNLRKNLANCMADCRQGRLILERRENNIKELKRINATIKKVDEMIEDSEERLYIYKYMAQAEMEMLVDMYQQEEDDVKESIRMYEKSEKYYSELKDGIPDLIEMIDYCLESMK